MTFNPILINLTKNTIPNIIPIPNAIKIGRTLKSKVNNDLIAFIIGIYKPNTNNKVDPDIPGNTIAVMAIDAATKTYR